MRVDRGSQTVRAYLAENFAQPLHILLQIFGPGFVDVLTPRDPERCRKQYEQGDAQCDVAEREVEGGKAEQSNYPQSACSPRCGWCAAAAARSPHRSFGAAC